MLLTDNDSVMYKIEAEIVCEDYYKVKSYLTSVITQKLIKILCVLTTKKNIYLKMDIVDYLIFINLLVHHIKYNFIKYRQFNLIITLFRKVILLIVYFNFHSSQLFSSQFFPPYKKPSFCVQ